MSARSRVGVFTATLGLFATWSACTAGELPAPKIKIGEKMADSSLPDTGGQQRSLHEFKGKKGVAVIFIATRCPYSNAFNQVMAKLEQEFQGRGVALGGINSNKTEPASEVAEHARRRRASSTWTKKVRQQHQSRVMLVNFWATWCEPCREEFPVIVCPHREYRDRGLSVVAISMDEPQSVAAIGKFLKEQDATFGSYRHNFNDFAALIDSINPRWGGGIPATFLYDREGRLVSSWQGATRFEELERAVAPLLP